jgi:hypothetical protein
MKADLLRMVGCMYVWLAGCLMANPDMDQNKEESVYDVNEDLYT